VNLRPEAVEELAEDELRAGVDVDVALPDAKVICDRPLERRRERFRVVVAPRKLRRCSLDRRLERRKRILAEKEGNPFEQGPALLDDRRCVSQPRRPFSG
jgi:hypothetical protein